MILDEIIKQKKKEIEELEKKQLSLQDFSNIPVRDFKASLKNKKISLIAETKAASPSAGVIFRNYDPATIAYIYEKNGASAISVLTDSLFFMGDLNHIKRVKDAVKLPVLRKDFILDESQVYESRLAGADAILLIVRILEKSKLENLYKLAISLGMEVLMEICSKEEAKIAIDIGASIIGINNRDLDSLKININKTVKILKDMPELTKKIVVSESGIKTKDDVSNLFSAGVSAFLVGESLLKSHDIGAKVCELLDIAK